MRENSYRARKQKTAGLIRYSCGILFMLFSFCYLYFLQGEILAEAQFVYSRGVTSYDLFWGAIITTIVLQIVQWLVAMASGLPSRWHAFSYLPSMLILAILTNVNKEVLVSFTLGEWVWIAPLVLLFYVLFVFVVRKFCDDYNVYTFDLKSQMYPNYIILFFLMLVTGSIPKTPDVYHYELKTERLILEKDYAAAAEVGEKSLRTTPRLTRLRMYALERQGLLAERLFEYPQHYGSQGLLNVADTFFYNRISSQDICAFLGAYCGKNVKSASQYYQLVFTDSLWNQHTIDYYLCSLLLDRKLKDFYDELPLYYNLSDTIVDAYENLPKSYREALLLVGDSDYAIQGKLVVDGDTIAVFKDKDFVMQFKEYHERKAGLSNETERINKTHREFGKTYWWYYDFNHLAEGELRKR
ncbi:MAG: hypothetical protein IKD25_06420 [Bacteroidaceae bacterium]|nr:hypothetical protein [Bacteroidaceae bacterium]